MIEFEFAKYFEIKEVGSRFKVLIVDDDEENQQVARLVVERLGVTNILTANNAMDALMSIRNQNIGLVLLDNELGSGMSGSDILEKVESWVKRGLIGKDQLPTFVGISATSDFNGLIPSVNKGKDFSGNLETKLREMMASQ